MTLLTCALLSFHIFLYKLRAAYTLCENNLEFLKNTIFEATELLLLFIQNNKSSLDFHGLKILIIAVKKSCLWPQRM